MSCSQVGTGVLDAGLPYLVGSKSFCLFLFKDKGFWDQSGKSASFAAFANHGTLDQLPNPETSVFSSVKWNHMISRRELMDGF